MAAGTIIVVELFIALFVRDDFVRPYLGDTLAVLLVYCALRAVTSLNIGGSAVAALAVAFLIELGQWVGLLRALGLEHSELARTVLGSGFDLKDLVAYTCGALAALAIEAGRRRWISSPG